MELYKGNVDGFNVTLTTTSAYDNGQIDNDTPSVNFWWSGKGKNGKFPVYGEPPKEITTSMIRCLLGDR